MNQATRGSVEFEDARRRAAEFHNRARKAAKGNRSSGPLTFMVAGRAGPSRTAEAVDVRHSVLGPALQERVQRNQHVRRLAGFLFQVSNE
jgi:hypothetical protein